MKRNIAQQTPHKLQKLHLTCNLQPEDQTLRYLPAKLYVNFVILFIVSLQRKSFRTFLSYISFFKSMSWEKFVRAPTINQNVFSSGL